MDPHGLAGGAADAARELAKSPFLGVIFEGFVASEVVKAQTNAGRRRELYYFRDQQGLEVDFLVPGPSGTMALVECKATRTVVPGMAASLIRLAEAMKSRRGRRAMPRAFLVHGSSRTASGVSTVAEGVRALPWKEFLQVLRGSVLS
ncbi:MAG: DUF4143 domain-containing protein [Vicinamibacteria bacterium]